MTKARQDKVILLLLYAAVAVNVLFWFSVRTLRVEWLNVPPAPSKQYAAAYGLGDPSFAYRINSLTLQNLGDTGGRVTPLKDYNFRTLAEWFFVQDHLDRQSDYIPFLAAYYFSGVQEPEKFRPVLSYLEEVGLRNTGEKWRFLVQAIYLARFVLKDLDKSLELAQKLVSNEYTVDLPGWVRQMPVFIMNAKGDKEVAYALMLEILKTNSEDMHPNEIHNMKYFMCTRLITEEEAKTNPLCESFK